MRKPKLRFAGFEDEWKPFQIKNVLRKVSRPVDVVSSGEYSQIGIRSHGKGIFHKAPVTGASLGDKRVFWVEPNALVVNIVFAWEQAVAVTTDREEGMVASHRFPMYVAKDFLAEPEFILRLFLTRKGKKLLELASPGGAGRNKTLGQKEFESLKIALPSPPEQRKVATFLLAVDERIRLEERKLARLREYKKSTAEKIFRQEIRFRNDVGEDFPDWELRPLGDVATFSKGKGLSKSDLVSDGRTKCILYGELYTTYGQIIPDAVSRTNVAAEGLVLSRKNDVIIPASGETPLDIATAACVLEPGIALGGDLNIIRTGVNGAFLAYCLSMHKRPEIAAMAQGNSVVHLYAKQLRSLLIPLPADKEQEKIAAFLSALDARIAGAMSRIEELRTFKRGLLQQLFV